jgi:hypothetical protein
MLRPIKDRSMWAFLAGFALCYAVGAVLTFNVLTTILRYPVEDALPRAALWWWTAHTGTTMFNEAIAKSRTGKILIP